MGLGWITDTVYGGLSGFLIAVLGRDMAAKSVGVVHNQVTSPIRNGVRPNDLVHITHDHLLLNTRPAAEHNQRVYRLNDGVRKKMEDTVRHYAPLVWLNEDDEPNARVSWPCSASHFLAHTTPHKNPATGEVFLYTDPPLEFPWEYREAFFRGQAPDTYVHGRSTTEEGGGGYAAYSSPETTPESYVLVYPGRLSGDPNTAVLDSTAKMDRGNFVAAYMMLFPYNVGKKIGVLGNVRVGNHVGDIEKVYLEFREWAPWRLRVEAHNLAPQVVPINATQPIHLYCARGSHGLWTSPGKHLYKPSAPWPIRDDLVDECAQGALWSLGKNLRLFEPREWIGLDNREELWWLTAVDRWGDPGMGPPIISRLTGKDNILNRGSTGFTSKPPFKVYVQVMRQSSGKGLGMNGILNTSMLSDQIYMKVPHKSTT